MARPIRKTTRERRHGHFGEIGYMAAAISCPRSDTSEELSLLADESRTQGSAHAAHAIRHDLKA